MHELTFVSLQDLQYLSFFTVYVMLAQDLMVELQSGSRVWAVDLLGQGRSWPQQAPEPDHKLAFSVDTWTAQIADFIRCVQALPICARHMCFCRCCATILYNVPDQIRVLVHHRKVVF